MYASPLSLALTLAPLALALFVCSAPALGVGLVLVRKSAVAVSSALLMSALILVFPALSLTLNPADLVCPAPALMFPAATLTVTLLVSGFGTLLALAPDLALTLVPLAVSRLV